MGKNIWFMPRFGLTPANAQVGQGAPAVSARLESMPFPAKLQMSAPRWPGAHDDAGCTIGELIAQSMDAALKPVPQPNCASVAEIAFWALATLRKRASPV